VVLQEVVGGDPNLPLFRDDWTGITWAYPKGRRVSFLDAARLCSELSITAPGAAWNLPSPWPLYGILDFSRPGCPGESSSRQASLLPLPWPTLVETCNDTIPFWTDQSLLVNPDVGRTVVMAGDGTTGVFHPDLSPVPLAFPVCANPPESPPPTALSSRFTVANTYRFDRLTGLLWQWSSDALTWKEALERCKKAGWRLPNVKELMTLVDDSRLSDCPVWYREFDSKCSPDAAFWSSTPVHWSAAMAYVLLSSGESIIQMRDMDQKAIAMCVRSFPYTPSAVPGGPP